MILIAEPVHFGATHVQVNSAFVALIRDNFPDQPITVVAENEHIAALKSNIPDPGLFSGIRFESFPAYSRPGLGYWFQKITGEWMQVWRVLLKTKREKPELLVWLCLFPTGQLLLQLLIKFLLPGQKQVIILHGELDYFAGVKRKTERWLQYFLRKAFSLSRNNTAYIVLGTSVKERLLELAFLPHERIFAFPHPFLYQQYVKREIVAEPALHICTFGTLKKTKNAQLFFELASRFSAEITAGQIVFTTVGKIFNDVMPYVHTRVNMYRPDAFLEQHEFEMALSTQDLALFFYDHERYRYSASGVLHEAMKLDLPFISLRNDYFSGAFEQGLYAADLDEMEALIRAILSDKKTNLTELHLSIAAFIHQNSFLLQSKNLGKLFKESSFFHSRY